MKPPFRYTPVMLAVAAFIFDIRAAAARDARRHWIEQSANEGWDTP